MSRRPVPTAVRAVAQLAASLAVLAAVLCFVLPRATAIERTIAGGPVTLPWLFAESGGLFQVDVTLSDRWTTPRLWEISADDRLHSVSVDGEKVPLQSVAAAGDPWTGIVLDLGAHLRSGPSVVSLVAENETDGGAIELYPRLGSRTGFLVLGFIPLLWVLGSWFRLDRTQLVICAAALVVIGLYWTKTPWYVREHDVDGHFGYIDYLLRERGVPPPNGGWSFFHPPLYYVGAALTLAAARAVDVVGYEVLQAYSLALWLTFLVASAGTLGLAMRGWALHAATLAVALWPSGVIHSVRIGNDSMLYACSGVATWFIVRWWQSDRRADLLFAASSCSIAMLAKSNGIVLALTLSGLFLLRTQRAARWRSRETWVNGLLSGGLVAIGVMLSLARGIYYYYIGAIPNWLVANTSLLDDDLRVPNAWQHYLTFDVVTFLRRPWHDGVDPESGYYNFWNSLFRTMLSGEGQYNGTWQRGIGFAWSFALILMLLCLLVSAGRSLRRFPTVWTHLPWLILAAGWVFSLMALRYTAPFACSNDFRYSIPLLVPFALAASNAGQYSRALLVGTAALSSVFFLLL